MSEMVERVARLLQNADGTFTSDAALDPMYVALASVVIEALREPTEAMLDAGWNGSGEAAETWAAMISAALNGPSDRGSAT